MMATALREEIALRIVPQKTMLDLIVVDPAEKM